MKKLLLLTLVALGLGAEVLACGCGIARRATTTFKPGPQQHVVPAR
ncbi:hypothetical protein H0W26_03670 [Candidatus Dependentiae bacterium]|nr:hypothetical protein [Candidatus Dependentiae bacterium]